LTVVVVHRELGVGASLTEANVESADAGLGDTGALSLSGNDLLDKGVGVGRKSATGHLDGTVAEGGAASTGGLSAGLAGAVIATVEFDNVALVAVTVAEALTTLSAVGGAIVRDGASSIEFGATIVEVQFAQDVLLLRIGGQRQESQNKGTAKEDCSIF